MTTLVGQNLSHYRILEELGRGGMGIAYRAEDVNLGRPVVVKVLPPDAAADPDRRERFRREARACSSLSHPGITAIYEAGETEGIYYICMEYVEGKTLRALLAHPLEILEAVEILAQVSDAVAAAHSQGIIHRDLKPENVMVTPAGRTKVLDFGLAAMAPPVGRPVGDLPTQMERLTSAGSRLGTVTYMSPEQSRAGQMGPPSDVFSLGAMLYEAIAGVPPFRGDTDLAILHAIGYDNPASLRARRPETPAAVEAIVRRALRKNPADRYRDAAALRDDLLQSRSGISAPAADSGVRAGSTTSIDSPSRRSFPAAGSLAAGGAAATARAGAASDYPLVGRSSQLNELDAAFGSALEGNGQVILVSGEAGIGKTRLIAECGTRFEAKGASYVIGRCLFREGGLPYQPFVEAADRLVALLGIDSGEDLQRYVAERMPALVGRLPVILSFLHLPGMTFAESAQPANKEHLLDAIAAFFVHAAREKPLLLHVDDMHWADEGTLDLFEYLARSFSRTRGVLVGTYRPEEARGFLTRLSAGDIFVHLPLQRLQEEETEQIVRAALPGAAIEQDFFERLHRDTAGNPFFVLEAIRLLGADGLVRRENERWVVDPRAVRASIPRRVHEVLARRLSRLSPAERQLLEAAACEGMTFRSTTLASCLSRQRFEVLSALQALERDHRLIRAEEDRYRFDHPMIREALYEGILPELRQEYHRLIAAHLIQRHGLPLLAELSPAGAAATAKRAGAPSSIVLAQRRTEAASIAYQLLEAREEEQAVPFLLVAASHARTLFANREAEASLDRAISVLAATDQAADGRSAERDRWIIKAHKDRGKLRVRLGDFDGARSDFVEMRGRAAAAGLPDKEAHAENLLADLCVRTGDYGSAMQHAQRAHDLAQEKGDRHSLASALAVMGVVQFNHGAFDQALASHSRSIVLQQSIGDSAGYADSLNKVGNIHLKQGRPAEALAVYSTALQVARQAHQRLYEAEALNNVGAVHHEQGDFDQALNHYEESLALKREIGDKRAIARGLNNLGLVREARGEFASALEAYQESLSLKRALGDQAGISSSLNNLGSLYEKMGAYGPALECCEESLSVKRALGETATIPYCQNSLGRLRLAFGQTDLAEGLFLEALGATREQGDLLEECRSRVNLAELRLAVGDHEQAAVRLAEAEALARRIGSQEMLVECLYLAGLTALGRNDLEAARLALGRLEEVGSKTSFAPLEVLEKHLGGLILKAAGKQADALGALERAADRARGIGLSGRLWRILDDAGRLAEAREVLLRIADSLADDEARGRFLGFGRAAEILASSAG